MEVFDTAIRTAEPWSIHSELAGLALLALVVVGLWYLLRARDR